MKYIFILWLSTVLAQDKPPLSEVAKRINMQLELGREITKSFLTSEEAMNEISTRFAQRFLDDLEIHWTTRSDKTMTEIFRQAAKRERWEQPFTEEVLRAKYLLEEIRRLRPQELLDKSAITRIILRRLREIRP